MNFASSTPLHVSIQKETRPIFQLLLEKGGAALEMKSSEGFPPLWYALTSPNQDLSMASTLLEYGASANTLCDEDSNTLLHCLIAEKKEKAALFLLQQTFIEVNLTNRMGETALHRAAYYGLANVVKALLDQEANPNLQTVFKTNEFQTDFRQTPLHLAIAEKHILVIQELLERKDNHTKPDYNIKNSSGKTKTFYITVFEMRWRKKVWPFWARKFNIFSSLIGQRK